MASGKKGKKTKGKTLALTDFLQETTGSIPVQPLRKSTLNWADEVEDYDGFDSRKPVNVVLPTAPKASRDYDDFSDKVPKDPPYSAYLSNLPYDVDEDEIAAFFKNMRIANMRIPRDDRNTDGPRSKGYGYIEFEDRESLLDALVLRDTTLKNRRMRIEVAANVGNERRGRMEMGRDRGERTDSFGDWRSGPRPETSEGEQRGGFSRDGGFNREGGFSRDGMRGGERGERGDRGFGRDNRDSGFNRDGRDRNNRDKDDDRGSNWRDGERANRDQDRGFTRRDNFRDSDRGSRFEDREDRRGFGGRRFEDRDGYSRGRDGRDNRDNRDGRDNRDSRDNRDDRDAEPANSEPRQRPRFVLAPRTKPLENVPVKSDTVPSASIFGSAKPVDTAKRELEIEEKLAKEHTDLDKDGSRDRRPMERLRDSSREARHFGRSSRDGSKERMVPEGSRDGSRERKPRDSSSRERKPKDNSRERKPKDSSRDRRPRDNSRERKPRDSSKEKRGRDNSRERKFGNTSTERKNYQDGDKKNVDRNRPPKTIDDSPHKEKENREEYHQRKNFDDKKGPAKNEKSPEKLDNRHKGDRPKKEEKRHEKEMPKLTEPEPPNFAANNKFAFLQTEDEDNSD